MMAVSAYAVGAFFVLLIGYNLSSTALQYLFYVRLKDRPALWKVQPSKTQSLGNAKWWIPALYAHKPGRATNHWLFASINIVVASIFAGGLTELIVRGYSRTVFDPLSLSVALKIGIDLLVALTWQSVAEYYWHRLLHLPVLYKMFHKYHHFYKSPEPFDDMYIHPLEAAGYYCILYSPPMLFPVHFYAFLIYMALLGVLGIVDHSGIIFSIPWLYHSRDHDAHHSQFEVNYSFPFPFVDIVHGTFEGSYGGRDYKPNKKR